jgi:hypothetical protein
MSKTFDGFPQNTSYENWVNLWYYEIKRFIKGGTKL